MENWPTVDLLRFWGSTALAHHVERTTGFELTGAPDADGGPDDVSYLTDADLADAGIAANVKAMAETNELITWFGRDPVGWVGLWRGPDRVPPDEAPIVRLDTEGQYELVGSTLADYLIGLADDPEAMTADLRDSGFPVPDVAGAPLSTSLTPDDYRNARYEAHLGG